MSCSVLFTLCLSTFTQAPAEAEIELREKIVYAQIGERELLLDAYLPAKKDPKPPAVLVVHGGAWRHGNRKQLRNYAKALTQRGFACFAIDYRLAPAHKFPAQIEDCRAAVRWIRKNAEKYSIDPHKLGAIGYSAGGHLVTLLATTGEKNDDGDTRLQAVAAGGAPTDFRWFPDNGKWAEYWMGGDLKTVPEKFRQASPGVFADKSDPPVFFFSGTKDKVVPLVWTRVGVQAMKNAGVRTELHTIQDAGHMQAARDAEALKKAYDFLQSELMRASLNDEIPNDE